MVFVLFLQVARAILENPNDNTKVHLIYANVTYEDILLKVKINLIFICGGCNEVSSNNIINVWVFSY